LNGKNMNGHGGMVRRTSGLTARVLRRRANENVKHAPSAIRIPLSFRPPPPPAPVLLVDNKGKTSHVRSFFPLEVQVHSRNRHDTPWQRSMQVFIKSATFRSPSKRPCSFDGVREPAPSRRCFSRCWHSMNGFQCVTGSFE
jgi:hypothetical protein